MFLNSRQGKLHKWLTIRVEDKMIRQLTGVNIRTSRRTLTVARHTFILILLLLTMSNHREEWLFPHLGLFEWSWLIFSHAFWFLFPIFFSSDSTFPVPTIVFLLTLYLSTLFCAIFIFFFLFLLSLALSTLPLSILFFLNSNQLFISFLFFFFFLSHEGMFEARPFALTLSLGWTPAGHHCPHTAVQLWGVVSIHTHSAIKPGEQELVGRELDAQQIYRTAEAAREKRVGNEWSRLILTFYVVHSIWCALSVSIMKACGD